MKVAPREPQPWRPPGAGEPTRWQLAQASGFLAGQAGPLAEALSGVVGREVVVEGVEAALALPSGQYVSAGGAQLERPLAVAMASALLGFSRPAAVDPEGPAERAVLTPVAEAFRQWLGADSDQGVWVVATVETAGETGRLCCQVLWERLWDAVAGQLRAASRRVSIERLEVDIAVQAVIECPAVELSRLLSLQPGECLPVTVGGRTEVVLFAGGRAVASGRLGAVRGKKAVRVEKLLLQGGDGDSGR